MKKAKGVIRNSWKMHAIFQCADCDWDDQDFMTAVDAARKHCEEKGHSVRGETAYCVTYDPAWKAKT